MTFVRAKLAIEMLDAGQVLEVLLDYEEASSSVPSSIEKRPASSIVNFLITVSVRFRLAEFIIDTWPRRQNTSTHLPN